MVPTLRVVAYLCCEEVRERFVVEHDTEDPKVINRGDDAGELIENAKKQCYWACGNDVQPEVVQQQERKKFGDTCH